jgi:hypothetical protein
MGSISVACYKPRPGFEQALLELVRNHLPPLRAEGLVTDRAPIVMRTADGTIVEVPTKVKLKDWPGAARLTVNPSEPTELKPPRR